MGKNMCTVNNKGIRRKPKDVFLAHALLILQMYLATGASAECFVLLLASFIANVDYYPVVKTLMFDSDEEKKVVFISIVDDIGRPRLEGNETFEILLNLPRNGRLVKQRSNAIVTIKDEESDSMYFNSSIKFYKQLTIILRIYN